MWILNFLIIFVCVIVGDSQFYHPRQGQRTNNYDVRARQDFVYPDFYFPTNDQGNENFFRPQTQTRAPVKPTSNAEKDPERPYQNNIFLQSLHQPNRLGERISQKSKLF